MFIGHLGVGLALKKLDSKINLLWFFASVLFSDILLWILVLLEIEHANIPYNYRELHYLTFYFPYSHGLFASLIWTALAYYLVKFVTRKDRTAIVLAIGVFSHFILDFIVHPPELPLLGEHSQKLGLGLWNNIYLALALELIILIVGLMFYFKSTEGKSFGGKYGMLIFMTILTFFAFAGQLFGPKPETENQVALSSLISIFLILILAFWLDRERKAINESKTDSNNN